jgi:hypothetical protein
MTRDNDGFSRHGLRCPMGGKRGPRPTSWKREPPSAIGAPSAELSLDGLRPRRARLRFTRRRDDSDNDRRGQEQCQGRWRGQEKCSEEIGVFGLDNGVHHNHPEKASP